MLLYAFSVIQVLFKIINEQGIFRLIIFVSSFSPEVSYKWVVLLLLKLLPSLAESTARRLIISLSGLDVSLIKRDGSFNCAIWNHKWFGMEVYGVLLWTIIFLVDALKCCINVVFINCHCLVLKGI